MNHSSALNTAPSTPMKKKIITALVAVVIGHVGVLWAVGQIKSPEFKAIEKEPLKVRFVKIQQSPKPLPPKPKAEPKKQTYLFSSNEIKELSTAFKSGSCDLTNLKKQSQKYDLSDTWVKLYDRTPKPLSELNNQQKCLLAQSNDLYAYADEFYDESQQSLNETWYKGNIPQDAKVATMRFMTPKALIPKCDSELGRPVLIDYEKDDNGKIVRTIIINEDFDYSCLKK